MPSRNIIFNSLFSFSVSPPLQPERTNVYLAFIVHTRSDLLRVYLYLSLSYMYVQTTIMRLHSLYFYDDMCRCYIAIYWVKGADMNC